MDGGRAPNGIGHLMMSIYEVSIYPGGPGTQEPSGHCVPGWAIWSTRVPNSISILWYTGGPTQVSKPGVYAP